MSRTYRKVVWPGWRNKRANDGFFNKYLPKHFYYTKKNKAPPLLEEEAVIYSDLYVFDEMWDLDEGYYCDHCGGWLTKWEHEMGWCEC